MSLYTYKIQKGKRKKLKYSNPYSKADNKNINRLYEFLKKELAQINGKPTYFV